MRTLVGFWWLSGCISTCPVGQHEANMYLSDLGNFRIFTCPGQALMSRPAYHITLKDDSDPVVHAPRKFPIHIRDELKAELDSMESQGVIKRVTAPTDSVIVWSRPANQTESSECALTPRTLISASKGAIIRHRHWRR